MSTVDALKECKVWKSLWGNEVVLNFVWWLVAKSATEEGSAGLPSGRPEALQRVASCAPAGNPATPN